jgi:hypothetical protein
MCLKMVIMSSEWGWKNVGIQMSLEGRDTWKYWRWDRITMGVTHALGAVKTWIATIGDFFVSHLDNLSVRKKEITAYTRLVSF